MPTVGGLGTDRLASSVERKGGGTPSKRNPQSIGDANASFRQPARAAGTLVDSRRGRGLAPQGQACFPTQLGSEPPAGGCLQTPGGFGEFGRSLGQVGRPPRRPRGRSPAQTLIPPEQWPTTRIDCCAPHPHPSCPG